MRGRHAGEFWASEGSSAVKGRASNTLAYLCEILGLGMREAMEAENAIDRPVAHFWLPAKQPACLLEPSNPPAFSWARSPGKKQVGNRVLSVGTCPV